VAYEIGEQASTSKTPNCAAVPSFQRGETVAAEREIIVHGGRGTLCWVSIGSPFSVDRCGDNVLAKGFAMVQA